MRLSKIILIDCQGSVLPILVKLVCGCLGNMENMIQTKYNIKACILKYNIKILPFLVHRVLFPPHRDQVKLIKDMNEKGIKLLSRPILLHACLY